MDLKKNLSFLAVFLLAQELLPLFLFLLGLQPESRWHMEPPNLYYISILFASIVIFILLLPLRFGFVDFIFKAVDTISRKFNKRVMWYVVTFIFSIASIHFFLSNFHGFRYSYHLGLASDSFLLIAVILKWVMRAFLSAVVFIKISTDSENGIPYIVKRNWPIVLISLTGLTLMASGIQDFLFSAIIVICLLPLSNRVFTRPFITIPNRILVLFFLFIPAAFIVLVGGEAVKIGESFINVLQHVGENLWRYISWVITRYSVYFYAASFWAARIADGGIDYSIPWRIIWDSLHYRLDVLLGHMPIRPDITTINVLNYRELYSMPNMHSGSSAGVLGTAIMLFPPLLAPFIAALYLRFIFSLLCYMTTGVNLTLLGILVVFALPRGFLINPALFLELGIMYAYFPSLLLAFLWLRKQVR